MVSSSYEEQKNKLYELLKDDKISIVEFEQKLLDLMANNQSVNEEDNDDSVVHRQDVPNSVRMQITNSSSSTTTTINESFFDKLDEQEELYKNGDKEKLCSDTKKTLQRYLRKLFCQVKFPADSDHDYKYPCFIITKHPVKQTVTICEWLLAKIG